MEPNIHRPQPLFENALAKDMEPFLYAVYELYLNCYYRTSADVDQAYQKLEALTSHMPYKESDPILCASNHLAAQYQYDGFRDGFRIGAAFAVSLVCM